LGRGNSRRWQRVRFKARRRSIPYPRRHCIAVVSVQPTRPLELRPEPHDDATLARRLPVVKEASSPAGVPWERPSSRPAQSPSSEPSCGAGLPCTRIRSRRGRWWRLLFSNAAGYASRSESGSGGGRGSGSGGGEGSEGGGGQRPGAVRAELDPEQVSIYTKDSTDQIS
jgi:uncharacterized membrane protein YgcG